MQPIVNQTHPTSIATVEEKIHLEKRLPFDPKNKTGPTTELYFHELTSRSSWGRKILCYGAGIIMGLFFILTLPIIGFFIICAQKPVFNKITVPGRRGIVFQKYQYSYQNFLFGSFLKKSGLHKLPSVINLWKGNLNLVGPHPYPAEWCNEWNKELSDYYKRFAVKPGFWGVAKQISNPEDLEEVSLSLEKELDYILNPSFKKDFKRLLGIY